MNAEEKIVTSAQIAAGLIDTADFVRLTKTALTLTGEELEKHVTENDRPGLVLPAHLIVNGKDEIAAILVLSDRSILGWTTGTFRLRYFTEVVPFHEIVSIDQSTRPGGMLSEDVELLTITMRRGSRTLVAPNVGAGGSTTAPLVRGALLGGIQPTFDDEPATGPIQLPPRGAGVPG